MSTLLNGTSKLARQDGNTRWTEVHRGGVNPSEKTRALDNLNESFFFLYLAFGKLVALQKKHNADSRIAGPWI